MHKGCKTKHIDTTQEQMPAHLMKSPSLAPLGRKTMVGKVFSPNFSEANSRSASACVGVGQGRAQSAGWALHVAPSNRQVSRVFLVGWL